MGRMEPGQIGAAISSRQLTDRGRAAIGLPPVESVVLVPLLDIPVREDHPTDEGA